MKQSNNLGSLIIGILVLLLVVWGVYHFVVEKPVTTTATATSTDTGLSTSTTGTNGNTPGIPVTGTPGKPKTLETYTNATYKFSISYPKELATEPFSAFHALSSADWRVNATSLKRGVPIIEIPVIKIDQGVTATGKKFPLYYAAEVRVGVSNDTKLCYATDDGYTKQVVTNVTIDGVPWKKFAFSTAATMQYVTGNSFRTIHNNKCYVVEQIKNGSTYKDQTMQPGYAQAELDAFYDKTTAIVNTFQFTN